MVDQVIKLKRNTSNTNAPDTSDIVVGELAIGAVAGKLYMRKSDDSILTFSDDSNVSTTLTIGADSGSNDTVTVGTDTLTFNGTSNQIGTTVSDNAITVALADDPVIGGTGSIRVPDGTTAQRPGSPAAGMFRYNTTTGKFEGYTDSWGDIGGGGSNTFTRNAFTGDGSTVGFTLSQTVNSENDLIVFIEGVFQDQDAYSVSGTTLTFDTAPASGRGIIVYSVKHTVAGSNLNIDTMTGDGSDTTLSLTISPNDENNTQVFIDGVYQNKSTYSISGSTLTFSTAPPNGSAVECMTFTQTDVNEATYVTANANNSTNETVYPTFVDGATGKQEIETDTGLTYNPSTGLLTTTLLAGTLNTAAQTNITSLGTLTALTVDDITIDGSTISDGGDFKIDADGDIRLDANGADLIFQDNGTDIGTFTNSSSDFVIASNVQDKDIVFKGNDGGSTITALTLDMSQAGLAVFGSSVHLDSDSAQLQFGDDNDMQIYHNGAHGEINVVTGNLTLDVAGDITLDADGGDIKFQDAGTDIFSIINNSTDVQLKTAVQDKDLIFIGNDGGSVIEAMRIDYSGGGKVGIGTTSPATPLEVQAAQNILLTLTSTTSSNNARMAFAPNDSTKWNIGVNISNDNFTFYDAANSTTPARIEPGAANNTLVIDSNSRIGIGTTSPGDLLELSGASPVIRGTDTDGGGAKINFGSGNITLDADYGAAESSSIINFKVDGSEAARFDSDGKLLIADSASHTDDFLQIESPASGGGHGIQIRRNDSNTDQQVGRILFGNNTDTDLVQIHAKTDGATDNGALIFSTQPDSGSLTERMRITHDGEVGIGTTSPAYALHVENSGSIAGLFSRSGSGTNSFENAMIIDAKTSNDAADGYGPALYFTFTDSGVTRSEIANISVIRDGADNSGQMQFGVRNAGTWDYDAMVIDKASNVGIRTASPDCPLHINGSANSEQVIITGNGNANRGLSISTAANGGQQDAAVIFNAQDTEHADYPMMAFQTGGTERMQISPGGDVGIGQTPITNSRLTVKTQGDGTYPIRVVNSADTDMLFGVYESSDGDGNNGMLYLNDGAGNTDVKISTNGDSYFNGGKVAIGADHADEPLTVRSSGENVDTYLIEVGNDLHASNTKDAWIKYVGGAATTDHSWATGILSNTFSIKQLGARGTAPSSATDRLKLDATGCMQLHSNGSGDTTIKLYEGSTIKWWIQNDTGGSPGSDSFWIGDEENDNGVYVAQDGSSWSGISDERLKRNWTNLENATDKIKTLTKVGTFQRRGKTTGKWSDNREVGLSAQEVEAILPEAITTGGDIEFASDDKVTGVKGLSYDKLVPLLVKSIQELEARIKTLEDA